MTRFMMTLDDAVDLVIYAFQHGKNGDLFVQKAPAATLNVLADALKSLYHSNADVKVIGTRHGEKLYETLVTREEMSKAEDMGDYYRIPCDTRDLNYDKFFVEYHTKADQHVLLNYSVNGGEYHKEEIPEVYDGIYVKAFVLLFGESVSYYISEKLHGEWKVVESRQISNQNMYGDKDQSRYDVINNIMFAYAMQDETMLSESMRKYVSMDDTVKKLFKLL